MWSPTQSPDELMHHQRLGAKWGIMNGPPYPLGRSQLSSAEKKAGGLISRFAEARKEKKKKKQRAKALEKARATRKAKAEEKNRQAEKEKQDAITKERLQEIVRSGSPEDVAKIKGKISNDDLQYALTRFEKEKNLDAVLSSTKPKSNYEVFMAASKKCGEIATASENFIKLYNSGAKVYNAVYGEKKNKKLPTI